MCAKSPFTSWFSDFLQILESLPDQITGKNIRYGMEDVALSAFSIFFTQTPSFLAYQRTMEKTKGRSNTQSLFGVHKIPSDNQIRNLLDSAQPKQIFPVFAKILNMIEQEGHLDKFLDFDNNLLIALDGTEYFSWNGGGARSSWSDSVEGGKWKQQYFEDEGIPSRFHDSS